MVIATLSSFPGRHYVPVGLVGGVSVANMRQPSEALADARHQMEAQATEMLADAVIDVRLQTTPTGTRDLTVAFLGTAIRFSSGRRFAETP